MVKIYEPETHERSTLDTFFENLAAITAPRFSSTFVDACARELARLGNNRELLWEYLLRCGGLDGWKRNFLPPQSFPLGSANGFMVRANIWLPPKRGGGAADAQYKQIYSYDLAHNHDFHFLTVGYFGPGYETDLYEINPEAIEGIPGEPVDLGARRREQLTPGRVIYFDAYNDVHVQHEPRELSISLNLLFSGVPRVRDQLLFDTERSVVIGSPTAGVTGRWRGVIEMAALLGNQRTWELLEQLSDTSPNTHIRKSARDALTHGRRDEDLLTQLSAAAKGREWGSP
jgi:hypothetical protein